MLGIIIAAIVGFVAGWLARSFLVRPGGDALIEIYEEEK